MPPFGGGALFGVGPRLPAALDGVMGMESIASPLKFNVHRVMMTPPYWAIFPFSHSKRDGEGGVLGQDPQASGGPALLFRHTQKFLGFAPRRRLQKRDRETFPGKGWPFGDLEGGRDGVQGCPAKRQ